MSSPRAAADARASSTRRQAVDEPTTAATHASRSWGRWEDSTILTAIAPFAAARRSS
ncbi:hypothetical protein [Nocardioides sp. W7]|uniref:hypothetical protein n=1 Tax=Nocardioides sp. W7 TaxID=2931390 RepID=UPI001FD57F8B|nr:hypothetical protein [Nocardioides sp. W7]